MTIRETTKPIWITSDDQPFDEERDAIEHEAGVTAKQKIPDFLETTKYKGKSQAMVTNAIVAWERYKATTSTETQEQGPC